MYSSGNNNILNKLLSKYCEHDPFKKDNIITVGIADSGCSDYYAASNADVANISTITNFVTASLPNSDTMY